MLYKVLSLLALSLFVVTRADDYFDYSAETDDAIASASLGDDSQQAVVANDNSNSTSIDDDTSVSVSGSDDTDTSTDDDDDDDDQGITSDDDDTDTSSDNDEGSSSDDDNNSDESDTDSSASSESSDSASDSSTDDTDTSTDDTETDTDDMTAISSFDTDSDDPCDDADEDDCLRIFDASGNQLCGYNPIDDECYGSVRRAGSMGVGGFDAGYVAAQDQAQQQSGNLRVIIGVLSAIIGILFITVVAGGYYFYTQSKKEIEKSIHEAQDETVSPMQQTIDINEKPMVSNHNESDVSPMMIES